MHDPSVQSPAAASFQPIADRLEAFFRTSPRAISQQVFPDSPTGWVFSAHRFVLHGFELAFEPPEAPTLAHFRVDLDEQKYKKGDVSELYEGRFHEHYGWSTLEGVQAAMDDEARYESDHAQFATPELTEYYRPANIYEITYVLEGARWVFKEVFSLKYGCTPVLWRALTGDPSGPARVISENAHWLEVLRS